MLQDLEVAEKLMTATCRTHLHSHLLYSVYHRKRNLHIVQNQLLKLASLALKRLFVKKDLLISPRSDLLSLSKSQLEQLIQVQKIEFPINKASNGFHAHFELI